MELVFFPVDDNVTFSVVGDSNVDLTGIIIAALEEEDEEEEGEEEEEEVGEEESDVFEILFSPKDPAFSSFIVIN